MKTLLDYIRVLLLCVGGMLVSCTVLIVMSEQLNGTITGKQNWIFFSLIWFAFSVLFVVITKKGKIPISFSLSDIIVLTIIAFLLISYPWKLNPAPDKLTIVLLLTAFWFLLRIVLVAYPFLFSFFIFIYVFTGGVEALWGFAQMFHWTDTTYMSEKLLGSFYTTEAYSGYLAMILPLSLSVSCYYRSCKKLQWWRATTLLYYTASISSVLMVIALILSANRIAWMAAFISSVWVVWLRLSINEKIKKKWNISSSVFKVITSIGILLLIIIAGSIGILKNNGIYNKIPLWKFTTNLASQNLLLGTGLGGFPNTILQLNEETLAKSPIHPENIEEIPYQKSLYVHNEYLQLLMEHGIVGLLFFIALLTTSFYLGLKNKQWGACGGLLSLAVFSFASYPLQIPSFLITFTFLLVICQVKYQNIIPPQEYYTYQPEPFTKGTAKSAKRALLQNFIVIFLTILFSFTTFILIAFNKKSLLRATITYEKNVSFNDEKTYYLRFVHYPEFFCEYAQNLNEAQHYEASIELLKNARHYCHHPALYDILAKNLIATGHYQEAETYLLQIVHQYPKRLNSYYLLAKLYSLPNYYHPEKMEEVVQIVLNNHRVTYSHLNSHMEKEMRDILNMKNRKRKTEKK